MRNSPLVLLVLSAVLAGCGTTAASPTAEPSQASPQPPVVLTSPAPTAAPATTPPPTAAPTPTAVPTPAPTPAPPAAPAALKLDCTYQYEPVERGVNSCWTSWGTQPDPFTLRWTDKSATETGFHVYGRVKGGVVNCSTGSSSVPMTAWKLIATVGAGTRSWRGPAMDALYGQLVAIPAGSIFFPEDLQLAVAAFNDGGESRRASPVHLYEEGHGVCGD